MLGRLHFVPFFAGLLLGIGIFFFAKPETQDRVVKWPHPSNVGKLTYRDRNGLCYHYKQKIVDCAQVKDSLEEFAFQ